MYKKTILSLSFCVILSPCFSLAAQTGEPSRRHIELSTRIDDLDRKIEELRDRYTDCAIKQRQTIADSAAAVDKAEKHGAALARTRGNLPSRVQSNENQISVLEQSLESFTSVIAQRKTGLKAAGDRLHGVIASYNREVAERKQELERAIQNRERVERNGNTVTTKNGQEAKRLGDSLERIDQSIAIVKKQFDSLGSVREENARDSLAATTKSGARLKKASQQCAELRAAIARNDSLLIAHTRELNELRKDSSTVAARYENGTREGKQNGKTLDSLVRALQDCKTALLSFKEVLALDATITVLTDQVRGLQQQAAAQKAIEEKQQLLASSSTKRDALARDTAVAALVANAGTKNHQQLHAEISAALSTLDQRLDSAAKAHDAMARSGIFIEKEYAAKSKQYTEYLTHLDSVISAMARQQINDKARLPALVQDSSKAAASLAAEVTAWQKKQAPITAAIAKKKAWLDGLKKMHDALASHMQQRESAHRSDRAEVQSRVRAAQKEQQTARAAYDSIAAQQQKARNDSIDVARKILDNIAETQLSLEMKQEEITVARGKHKELLDLVREARADSAAAAQEKRQLEVTYQRKLSELQREIMETETDLNELEKQRAALRRQLAGK
ncbi:MAG: hypothetical protein JW768_05775 [Chitinispirillaceae bacterium]|nr:hypothetical protein [Chitinispirillaceae bacterium]